MGLGNDRQNYQMMDVTACHLKDSKKPLALSLSLTLLLFLPQTAA